MGPAIVRAIQPAAAAGDWDRGNGSVASWFASSALHLVPRFAEQVSFRRSRRGRRPRLPGRAKLGSSARVAACMWGASANFPNPPPPPGARSRSTFTTHWAARTSWAIRPSAATRTTVSAVSISCSCGKGPVLSAVEGMGHLSWDGAKGGPARPTAHGIRTQGLDVRELTLLAEGVKYFLLTSPFIEPAGRTLPRRAYATTRRVVGTV